MKKVITALFISIFFAFNASAESISEKISDLIDNFFPGEGVTDVSIQVHEEDNPDIEILTNRSLDKTDTSNTFVQMSLHTQETNNKNRLITNLGYGYRELTEDKSIMYGANGFIDIESEGHLRASFGLEVKGKILDLNANFYEAISGKEKVGGVNEEVLSGYQLNLATQMPYMPWSTLNIQNYYFESI